MKKIVHFFLAFNLFLSCENPSIIETISDKNVSISFRKDDPQFIKNMRNVTDSLKLSIGFGKRKTEIIGKKIEW